MTTTIATQACMDTMWYECEPLLVSNNAGERNLTHCILKT